MSFSRLSWNCSIASLCILALLYVVSTGIAATHTKLNLRPRMELQQTHILFPDGVIKYKFQKNGAPLKYGEALDMLMRGDDTLASMLTGIISSFPSTAVFWECISVTPQSVGVTVFEFVLLPAAKLASITPDIEPFKEKCMSHSSENADDSMAVFYNLNKDALLVVPCPSEKSHYIDSPAYMAHLATFIRGESSVRTAEFWKTVASAMIQTLKQSVEESDRNKRFWLSTSGLGVSWLHVRIDTRPKYYNWEEYKNVA